jgi:hypothetical protein
LQATELLERQEQQLRRLSSLRGLERWRDAIVQSNALRNGAHGCPLGSLSSELADHDEGARRTLADHFATWEGLLAAGLTRMRDTGVLRADAEPDRLATGLTAALQGGYLLAQAAHDTTPMRIALDMAIDQIRTFATAHTGRREGQVADREGVFSALGPRGEDRCAPPTVSPHLSGPVRLVGA